MSDLYGRILVQAGRDEEAVLIADLELEQREDWLELFPFLRTRRPDTYAALTEPVDPAAPYGRRPAPAGMAATEPSETVATAESAAPADPVPANERRAVETGA